MVTAAVRRTELIPLLAPRVVGEVVRHAPAARRLRLQVDGLLGQPRLAARIEREVRGRPGVEWVRADPVSGRVAIGYAPDARVLDHLETRLAPAAPRRRRGLRARLRARRDGRAAAPAAGEPWYALAAEEVLAHLGAGRGGLEPAEAARRLARFGHNEPDPTEPRSRLAIVVEQIWNLPSGLLLGSAAASLLLGDLIDAGAILAVTAMNAAIGYQLERHSEDLVGSWRRLEAGVARVLRGGAAVEVPASEVVPGDLLLCRAGDVVPADARVLDGRGLACDEAPLTGESAPRDKDRAPVARGAPLAERDSMIYAGTTVASGHGLAVVVATGAATEVARVRALLQGEHPPRAPIQERMEHLVRRASQLGLAAGGAAALAGLLRRRPLAAISRGAVALGVAAIPEGLPVTATAAQVRAMQRMRRRGVVARRVSAAETLGSVTVVCADKTGTLTRNAMELECLALPDRTWRAAELDVDPRDPLAAGASRALAALVLSSELDLTATGRGGAAPLASATEIALIEGARRAGLDPDALARSLPRRSLEVRGDGRHYVTSVHDGPGGAPLAFVKGAPEQIVALCATCGGAPLDEPARAALLARNRALASSGLRVLAVAWGRGAMASGRRGLDFLGLVGLRDPTRASAAAAVRGAAAAGIRTIILTGDQRATASAVARETGLAGEVIDGGELAAALERGDPAARARLGRIAALSRVTPADKLIIVRALRAAGEVVAMAGDGVNDA
ncbi:MAG TPA: HAD-IC family P-type ATPase, partial [Kofleriaceae bacterium]|nr:HAD-IC family P-type ATPase [Kofleriaceae bacterium]